MILNKPCKEEPENMQSSDPLFKAVQIPVEVFCPFSGLRTWSAWNPWLSNRSKDRKTIQAILERRKVKFTYTKLVQTEVLDRAAHFKQAEDKKKWDRNYVTYCD